MDPVVADSARRHGITDDDMLHAYRYPTRVDYHDDGVTMFYGADRAGNPLEVGFVSADDGAVVIVHAMKDRTKR